MSSVGLSSSGPPETVLPPESTAVLEAIAAADELEGQARRDALVDLVAHHPRSVLAWATLATTGRDRIETYASNRIGYHRGLDLLRANGWRGTGYVRWRHETNRPFLTALAGLAGSARQIGEDDEVERCETFLRQLDPDWPPADP